MEKSPVPVADSKLLGCCCLFSDFFCCCCLLVNLQIFYFLLFLPWLFGKIYKDQLNSMSKNMSTLFLLVKPKDLDLRLYILSNVPSSQCDEESSLL